MSLLSYKGYTGSIEFSAEDNIMYGRVLGLKNSIISYEGKSFQELENDFKDGINDYLAGCIAEHEEPETSSKDSVRKDWNVLLDQELA